MAQQPVALGQKDVRGVRKRYQSGDVLDWNAPGKPSVGTAGCGSIEAFSQDFADHCVTGILDPATVVVLIVRDQDADSMGGVAESDDRLARVDAVDGQAADSARPKAGRGSDCIAFEVDAL